MTDIILFLLGLFVGGFGTLIGVGGGFILVPIFLLILDYTPQHAVGTSLAIVFLNAISGTLAYVKQKKIYYEAAIYFSLATLPGAFFGSYLAKYFTHRLFSIVFGILLVTIAIIVYMRTRNKDMKPQELDTSFAYNKTLGVAISLLIGFISSILGIGGGIIHVPAMVYLLKFPTHIATATSHFVLCISAFTGVISHYLLGNILSKPALIIGAGAVIGAQVGARLSTKITSKPILILLSIALLLLGVRLIIQ